MRKRIKTLMVAGVCMLVNMTTNAYGHGYGYGYDHNRNANHGYRNDYNHNRDGNQGYRPTYGGNYAGEMRLDGQYYSERVVRSQLDREGIGSVRTFTLRQPAMVTFNAVAYGTGSVEYRLFNEYDERFTNCTFKSRRGVAGTYTYILPAGRYKLKARVYDVGDSYIDCRIKGEISNIPPTISGSFSRPYNCPQIMLGQHIVNMISTKDDRVDRQQYYCINVPRTGNITLMAERISPIGSMSFEILDGNEQSVRKYMFLESRPLRAVIALPAGQYYIKADRRSASLDGIVYRFMVY